MNTKKADWINAPKEIEWSLHSLRVAADGEHTLLFTVGERDEVRITCRTGLSHAFIMLHTPEEYIAIRPDAIISTFGGVRTEIPVSASESITFRKEGKAVSFISEGRTLLSVEKDAFASSASFGITLKGTGEAYIEVF